MPGADVVATALTRSVSLLQQGLILCNTVVGRGHDPADQVTNISLLQLMKYPSFIG